MAFYGPQYNAYGAMPQHLEAGQPGLNKLAPAYEGFVKKQRTRTSLTGLCSTLLAPWFLFTLLYAATTFSLHYQFPFLCWVIVVAGVVLGLAIGGVAVYKARDSNVQWLLFLFLTTMLASLGGPLLGDLNYWTNTQPYYDLQTLNEYNNVDPSKAHGQQMMDSGKVQFASGATLDLKKAWQFQDLDTYCVAPISMGTSTLDTYDFWAIGLNCCERIGNLIEYKCGEYKNKEAREGLRLMNENQRNFFRLAVQQAEAQYRILSKQPVFFYWTEDASADMASYWSMGHTYFWCGVGAFLVLQIFLVLVASVLFSKYEF